MSREIEFKNKVEQLEKLKEKILIMIDGEIRELREEDYQCRAREGKLTVAENEFLWEGDGEQGGNNE